MSSMIELLMGMFSGNTLGKVSEQVGIPEDKVQKVLPDIIAVLTGMLAKNASRSKGAKSLSNALSKDHDGSVLNNIISYIGNYQSGEGNGILSHVMGENRTAVEQDLSKKTGLDASTIGNLLTMAAPLIMGMLGKAQKQQSLDPGSLVSILNNEKSQAESKATGAIDIINQKRKVKTSPKKEVIKQKRMDTPDISKIKNPQDVFDIAKQRLLSNPGKYKETNFRCQFDILGSNGGKWYVLADDKYKEISKGIIEDPIATAVIGDSDFIKLVQGKLNAPMALFSGKIKIRGDMNHIIKLVELVLS